MQDPEPWSTLLRAIAPGFPPAVVVGIAVYLGKGFFANLLDRGLAKQRAMLDQTHDLHVRKAQQAHERALLELKAQVERRHAVHAISFERLQEKRFDMLANLYGVLLEAYWHLERITEPTASDDGGFRTSELEGFYERFQTLNDVLSKRVILVPDTLAKEARCSALALVSVADQVRRDLDSAYDKWSVLRDEVKPRLDALADEFRVLLGVSGEEEAAEEPATGLQL